MPTSSIDTQQGAIRLLDYFWETSFKAAIHPDTGEQSDMVFLSCHICGSEEHFLSHTRPTPHLADYAFARGWRYALTDSGVFPVCPACSGQGCGFSALDDAQFRVVFQDGIWFFLQKRGEHRTVPMTDMSDKAAWIAVANALAEKVRDGRG